MNIIYKDVDDNIIHKCVSDIVPQENQTIMIKQQQYFVKNIIFNVDKQKYYVIIDKRQLLT